MQEIPVLCREQEDQPIDQPKQLFMTQDGGKDLLWITDMGNNKLRKITINNGATLRKTGNSGVTINPGVTIGTGGGTIDISDTGSNAGRRDP